MIIRTASKNDFEQIWKIFQTIVATGDTYVYDPLISQEEALQTWCLTPRATYVAEKDGEILATYYLKTNQPGLGSHVCNCGYMVASHARGQGIATLLCEHSQQEALRMGYNAMQFNLVVSTNIQAVNLWVKLGFQIIGTLPLAFNHSSKGLTDAYVMYKLLNK